MATAKRPPKAAPRPSRRSEPAEAVPSPEEINAALVEALEAYRMLEAEWVEANTRLQHARRILVAALEAAGLNHVHWS